MRHQLGNKQGFTLIELMVASLIIMVSCAALYFMFIQGQVLINEQDHRITAFERAKALLISEKAKFYNNEFSTGVVTEDDFLVAPDEESNFEGVAATYIIDKSFIDDIPKVIVTYTWVEFTGRNYQVQLASYFIKSKY